MQRTVYNRNFCQKTVYNQWLKKPPYISGKRLTDLIKRIRESVGIDKVEFEGEKEMCVGYYGNSDYPNGFLYVRNYRIYPHDVRLRHERYQESYSKKGCGIKIRLYGERKEVGKIEKIVKKLLNQI